MLEKINLSIRVSKIYESSKLYKYLINHLKSLEIAWSHSKITWIALNRIFLFSKIFQIFFLWLQRMENTNNKNKNIEKKYFGNIQKNQFV